MPSRSFSSVDLPAPFGPTKATRDSKSRPKSKSLYITGWELRQQSQFCEMEIFFCLHFLYDEAPRSISTLSFSMSPSSFSEFVIAFMTMNEVCTVN